MQFNPMTSLPVDQMQKRGYRTPDFNPYGKQQKVGQGQHMQSTKMPLPQVPEGESIEKYLPLLLGIGGGGLGGVMSGGSSDNLSGLLGMGGAFGGDNKAGSLGLLGGLLG